MGDLVEHTVLYFHQVAYKRCDETTFVEQSVLSGSGRPSHPTGRELTFYEMLLYTTTSRPALRSTQPI
jgi:hypothetical protein